jgi:hypothetical protein
VGFEPRVARLRRLNVSRRGGIEDLKQILLYAERLVCVA